MTQNYNLIISEFCITDDFTQTVEIKKLVNVKRLRKHKLAISEIIYIARKFYTSGYQTFKDFYTKFVTVFWRQWFPNLPSYNRFNELMRRYVPAIETQFLQWLMGKLRTESSVAIVDSSKLQICHMLRKKRAKKSLLKRSARIGKNLAGFYFGFKLHFLMDMHGQPLNFRVTAANVDDRRALRTMLDGFRGTVVGDKGYLSAQLSKDLAKSGIRLLTRVKSNAKQILPCTAHDRYLLQSRSFIETVFSKLKLGFNLEHSRHRSISGFMTHIFLCISSYYFDQFSHLANISP